MKKISKLYGESHIAWRKCHDCGAKTTDYRCPKCLAKWRKKHGVSLSTTEPDCLDEANDTLHMEDEE